MGTAYCVKARVRLLGWVLLLCQPATEILPSASALKNADSQSVSVYAASERYKILTKLASEP